MVQTKGREGTKRHHDDQGGTPPRMLWRCHEVAAGCRSRHTFRRHCACGVDRTNASQQQNARCGSAAADRPVLRAAATTGVQQGAADHPDGISRVPGARELIAEPPAATATTATQRRYLFCSVSNPTRCMPSTTMIQGCTDPLPAPVKVLGMGSSGQDLLAQVAAFPRPDDKLRTEQFEAQVRRRGVVRSSLARAVLH